MKLRSKLLLAGLPLALALAFVGIVGVWSVSALSVQTQLILEDNYRSVLAMQRIKESIERIDSAALFVPLGHDRQATAQIADHRRQLEAELAVQEANITERGEADATQRLRVAWTNFARSLDEYLSLDEAAAEGKFYFARLEPAFAAVKQAADDILALNQDTMVHKSDRAEQFGSRINAALATVSILSLIGGVAASVWFMRRLLAPLTDLAQAVTQLGAGDFQSRAPVTASDEIGGLAAQFNAMAEHLQEYRSSSLGELLLAQEASKAAIDSIPDPVIVFAAEGDVLQMNQEAEALAANGRIAPHQDFVSRLAPQLRQPLEQARLHVLKGRGPYLPQGLEEAIAIPGEGGQRWLLVRATPVYQKSGSIAGATVILQDVSRLHRFDELKNDLVATVAHEFRTPLTSLRMGIHLCLEGLAGPLTEKQADLLQAGREDCQRLQTTVDELLDLARIQSGRLEMHRRTIPAKVLVEDAVESLHLQAHDKSVQLTADPLLPADAVTADEERIHLVFSNLLSNAIRHTPAGGAIRLGAALDGEQVRFTVCDTGEGIAPEHQTAIFERFYRVPHAASGAAGLGLPLTREIIQAHGGAIGVESNLGKGSTFWFTLPLAERRPKS